MYQYASGVFFSKKIEMEFFDIDWPIIILLMHDSVHVLSWHLGVGMSPLNWLRSILEAF